MLEGGETVGSRQQGQDSTGQEMVREMAQDRKQRRDGVGQEAAWVMACARAVSRWWG